MTTTRKSGRKNEEDFESFVRDTLATINSNIEDIKKIQSNLSKDVAELKDRVSCNQKTLDSLNLKYEKINGELFDYSNKTDELSKCVSSQMESIDDLKVQLASYKERCLNLERYSRDFNLRFLNIPEEQDEDCIAKLQDILYETLGYEATIENAHRTGRRRPGKPRHIIAKFLYRTERRKVLLNRKNLSDNVWIIEDLIKEDVDKKKSYQDIMKKAYQEGKKPRFTHGKLYINGALYKD